jgi:hypothetical protein
MDSHHSPVEPAEFEFDTEALGELAEGQRAFLRLAADAIRRVEPDHLDIGRVELGLEKGALWVTFPHRHDEECLVMATVSADETVVSYSYEHEHFWPDDPENGRAWPIDAPDYVAAAARFLEQILLGRIELEVRRGFVMQKTKSFWINDAGEREVFLRGGTVMPTFRRQASRLIRLDFRARHTT